MEYPQYTNNQAKVIVTTENGNKKRAMFYWNGGKPTFASYGMDITDSVIDWEYENAVEGLKIGDTVYQCDGFRIYSLTIQNIYYHQGRAVYDTDGIAFDNRAIGESIFTSKEEAKKLLFV